MDEIPAYSKIPPITQFADIFNHEFYYLPPESWHFVMTDVVNSTGAIEEGRYKEVNTAGSLGAMAISNILGDMQFPFVFGGDGMTYLIPGQLLDRVVEVLIDTRDMVQKVFDLKLRVGVIPLRELIRQNAQIRVARFAVSPRYTQAIIGGSGADLAETLIKDPSPANPWIVPEDAPVPGVADFSGFTCRWQDIPSRNGETISFIVRARGASAERRSEILKSVLRDVGEQFGTEERYHPLSLEGQRQSRSQFRSEARVLSGRRRGALYAFRFIAISLETTALKIIEKLRIPLHRRGKYFRDVKMDNIINSDFRKFDGTLKMVLSCSTGERKKFQRVLERRRAAGELYYGIHVSDRALLTCLIQFSSGEEVHFVDAADGGYAAAALMIKSQIAEDGEASPSGGRS